MRIFIWSLLERDVSWTLLEAIKNIWPLEPLQRVQTATALTKVECVLMKWPLTRHRLIIFGYGTVKICNGYIWQLVTRLSNIHCKVNVISFYFFRVKQCNYSDFFLVFLTIAISRSHKLKQLAHLIHTNSSPQPVCSCLPLCLHWAGWQIVMVIGQSSDQSCVAVCS